jgi:predicted metalloprotease with PDZ domain
MQSHTSKYLFGKCFLLLLSLSVSVLVTAQTPSIHFTLSFPQAAEHFVGVEMKYDPKGKKAVEFELPNWTTGYYQLMYFSKDLKDFKVRNAKGDTLVWKQQTPNRWAINSDGQPFTVSYRIFGNRRFVASNYVDEEFAYLSPAGIFLYPVGGLAYSSVIRIQPHTNWNRIATGLDLVKGESYTYRSPDFDILYDSPFLLGSKLEDLPSFTVNNKPHYFVAYKPGEFDRTTFMNDLQKIVSTASGIIGDIPYEHYSFLAIGPGGGGIEHLNSTSISFSGQGLSTNRAARNRMYHFLAHEYFHHYNVKRIRPIELGPFDYNKGSRTNSLWVSEGLNVYYENLILKRAGLKTDEEALATVQQQVASYEAKPGRLFQTLAASSYETWSDGPFGRTGDEVNKTISYYDKGPVVGVMLDFRIRHTTGNKRSLDDVMRKLYYEYYKKKGRGFTEAELKKEIETVCGEKMDDFFDYIYTLKPLDYNRYFAYAGLLVDQTPKMIPAYAGVFVTDRRDTVVVNAVDWQSPAWNAGLRRQAKVLSVNNQPVKTAADYTKAIAGMKTGDEMRMQVITGNETVMLTFKLAEKEERSYALTIDPSANATAVKVRNGWLTGQTEK